MTSSKENLMNKVIFERYFKPHFFEWIFGPIDRLVCSQDALIGFIFMSCVIDYLSGFWYGGDTTGKNKRTYIGFIKTYFPAGKYDPTGLYDSLRNGLVHMFTIKDKKYALTHNNPGLHMKTDTNCQIVLNAGDFRNDLYDATIKYFEDVENNPELMDKLIVRYGEFGFLALGKSEFSPS